MNEMPTSVGNVAIKDNLATPELSLIEGITISLIVASILVPITLWGRNCLKGN